MRSVELSKVTAMHDDEYHPGAFGRFACVVFTFVVAAVMAVLVWLCLGEPHVH